MEKYIPYEKMSKKQQRALNRQKRGGWGALNPVTRRPENPKAYKRKKYRTFENDGTSFLFAARFQPDGVQHKTTRLLAGGFR